MVEKGLECVSDNRLTSITKVHVKSAEVSAGGVNEIRCAYVILVHGGQSCAREGSLDWLIGVELDVEFSCAAFELLVERR